MWYSKTHFCDNLYMKSPIELSFSPWPNWIWKFAVLYRTGLLSVVLCPDSKEPIYSVETIYILCFFPYKSDSKWWKWLFLVSFFPSLITYVKIYYWDICACLILYQNIVKLVKINFLIQNSYMFNFQNQLKNK